jgi:mono/diheme cytochrome c family protein
VLSFTPQYPLWSDGAIKRRWIRLPAGSAIDARHADAWEFPPGTRLWKEFSVGRRVETRLIERLADGTWRFATYIWNDEGTDAVLAPARGIAALPIAGAFQGRYEIPGEADCRACHEGAAAPVLGFSALQLSPDRDPLAPHAERPGAADVDLNRLVARGLVRNLPAALRAAPPRIAARTPTERAVLGYLHGNCGHCHGAPDGGVSVPVNLQLAQSVTNDASAETVLRSMVGAPSRFRSAAAAAPRIVTTGAPDRSVLVLRMQTRHPQAQMPPLGTRLTDSEALELIERWIRTDLSTREET